MNWWIGGGMVAVFGLVVGLGGVFLLPKLIGPLLSDALPARWEPKLVTRLLRLSACFVVANVLAGLVPGAFVFAALDQFFRNTVNEWMSGPDLFRHLAIGEGDYAKQPMRIRQALAEIAVRGDDEDEALKQFISVVSTRELGLVDAVAKYALDDALVWVGGMDPQGWHGEIPGQDLDLLEGAGVVQPRSALDNKGVVLKNGDTAQLKGYRYTLRVSGDGADAIVAWRYISLMETGRKLVRALRRPTSLPYLCRLQRYFHAKQMLAEIWVQADSGTVESKLAADACEVLDDDLAR